MKNLISFDTETHRIGKGSVVPKMVCASISYWNEANKASDDFLITVLTPGYKEMLYDIFSDPNNTIIAHNLKFDTGVITRDDQKMMDIIWEAYEAGRLICTQIQEKLLNLTEHGGIDVVDGMSAQYSQVYLETQYLGIDRSDLKTGDDIWRLNYDSLEDIPVEDWPQDAIDYAIDDAKYCIQIYWAQQQRRQSVINRIGHDPFKTLNLHVKSDFALSLATAEGSRIDPERLLLVEDEFTEKYNEQRLVQPLVEAGFVEPAMPSTPSFRVTHLKSCKGHRKHEDWVKGASIACDCPISYVKDHIETCDRKKGCDCPVKMNKPKKEVYKKAPFHDYCWQLARKFPEDIDLMFAKATLRDIKNGELGYEKVDVLKGEKTIRKEFIKENPTRPKDINLQVDDEWRSTCQHLDELLDTYCERENYKKIITSYLPGLFWKDAPDTPMPADRVHSGFDALKETGRTSSKAAKLKKADDNGNKYMYPSWNGQQVDPRVRQVIVPDDGYSLFSIDYDGMELGTLAQVCRRLFGFSKLGETINGTEGNAHGFLGAQIARELDEVFAREADEYFELSKDEPLHDEIEWSDYWLFAMLEGASIPCESESFRDAYFQKHPDKDKDYVPTWGDFYKYYRTIAKPVDLGYPGGLGAPTLIAFARPYGLKINKEQAQHLKGIWTKCWPDMGMYLDYISKNSFDQDHVPIMVTDDEGKPKKKRFYSYETPEGMHRAKTTFCACANGLGLQSPGAEGAKSAIIEIQRLCYTTNDSVLSRVGKEKPPVQMQIFIHDEIFGQVDSSDIKVRHECMKLMEEVMIRNMTEIASQDVRVGAEACLMDRWSKDAKPVYNEEGLLLDWEHPEYENK